MKQYKVNINGKQFDITVEETTLGESKSEPKSAVVPVSIQQQSSVSQNAPVTFAVAGNGSQVTAPMPGTVLKIKVKNGATVKKGDPIVVLEAMKMENEISATVNGTVTVCVGEGAKVNSGDVIAVIA